MDTQFCRKAIVACVLSAAIFLLGTPSIEAKSSSGVGLLAATPTLPLAAERRDETITLISRKGVESEELEIYAPEASFIKLHFSRFRLPRGVVVEVSNPEGSEVYRYSSTHRSAMTFNREEGDDGINSFSAMSISGDTAIVRVRGKLGAVQGFKHLVEIDYFMEGLPDYAIGAADSSAISTSFLERDAEDPISRPESRCGVEDREDVACLEGSFPYPVDRSRPVARLLIGGNTLCTAWRLGSGNFLMSNRHCLVDQADVTSTEVWFDYQRSVCGGGDISSGLVKVAGDALLKSSYDLDFTLFTVNDFESIEGFGYLGLEPRDGVIGEEVYIPQHGGGNPKEIAITSDMNPGGFCQIDALGLNAYAAGTDVGYYCDTSGGSSGSPVVAANSDRVVALHHLGGCLNAGVSMSLIWPEISEFFNGVVPVGDDEDPNANQPPNAQFTVSCSELSCVFDAASSSDVDGVIVSYSWDLGDGNASTGMSVSHDYAASGSFQAVLTVQDEHGAVDQSTATVTVEEANASPVAAFAVSCAQGVCSFDAGASSDSDGQITAYAWNFGDGSSDASSSAVMGHEYAAGGDYLVRLTVTDNASATGQAESWIAVAINPPPNQNPVAAFTFDCQDLSCTFNASGSGDPDGLITSYEWSFGDGNIGSGESTAHTFPAQGTYEVTLAVTDNGEASDFVTQQVQVVQASSDEFELSVTTEKVRGTKSSYLTWIGSSAAAVDIFRDGAILASVENSGDFTDSNVHNRVKSVTYRVCEAATTVCSNEVLVEF